MQAIKSKLTEEQRKEFFKELHRGISCASYASSVYESIYIIESSLVDLCEGGVTDQEIYQEIQNRNLNKCYAALSSAQGEYEQRDECGISPQDARQLRDLLGHLENSSCTLYLQTKKAKEKAIVDEIDRYRREQEKILERKAIPVVVDDPVINVANIQEVFGIRIAYVKYENSESEKDAVFKIYCSAFSNNDLHELSARFSRKKIIHDKLMPPGGDQDKYILLKGENVCQFKILLQKLLPQAYETIDRDQVEHPIFNKKNIKNKLNISIESVDCSGNRDISVTECLTIKFSQPCGEHLRVISDVLEKEHIAFSHPLFANYIIMSGDNIDRFVSLLSGTTIDLAKEFHRYRVQLPKNHEIIFDKENIKKTFSLSSNSVFQIEYFKDFGLLSYFRIEFDKENWEFVNELSGSLKKLGIMHSQKQGQNYSTTIDIAENSLSKFSNLLIKNVDPELINNFILEQKKLESKKQKVHTFSQVFEGFTPGLVSAKKPPDISNDSIKKFFGEKIASAIMRIDLSNYTLIGWVMIEFNNSYSEELEEFRRILNKNGITHKKSGPKNRTIFFEDEQACRSLEKLLFSASQPLMSNESQKIPAEASHIEQEAADAKQIKKAKGGIMPKKVKKKTKSAKEIVQVSNVSDVVGAVLGQDPIASIETQLVSRPGRHEYFRFREARSGVFFTPSDAHKSGKNSMHMRERSEILASTIATVSDDSTPSSVPDNTAKNYHRIVNSDKSVDGVSFADDRTVNGKGEEPLKAALASIEVTDSAETPRRVFASSGPK